MRFSTLVLLLVAAYFSTGAPLGEPEATAGIVVEHKATSHVHTTELDLTAKASSDGYELRDTIDFENKVADIPVLLSRIDLDRRGDPDDRKTYGFVHVEKTKQEFALYEPFNETMWCYELPTNQGNIISAKINNTGVCFFYEHPCDPSRGKAVALIGWAKDDVKEFKNKNYKGYGCRDL